MPATRSIHRRRRCYYRWRPPHCRRWRLLLTRSAPKWELIDGALSINGSLFRTKQINVRAPDPTNPLLNILAGNAVAKGGELLVAGNITNRWQILAGYAYTFAEITQSPTVGATSDLGHRLANVPAHTANLWTTYRLPGNVEIGGGLNVVSSRFAATTPSTAGRRRLLQGGTWLLDAAGDGEIPGNRKRRVSVQPL